jgi:hypothetical protein
MHGGQTARRLEHPQSTQERGLTIEALAHQAHVSAAWLGEEFRNGQAPGRVGRRIDQAAISSSAGIRPHEAAHTAGAPAEVRV